MEASGEKRKVVSAEVDSEASAGGRGEGQDGVWGRRIASAEGGGVQEEEASGRGGEVVGHSGRGGKVDGSAEAEGWDEGFGEGG